MIHDLIRWLFFTLYDGIASILSWISSPFSLLILFVIWESWTVWEMFYERDKKIEDLKDEIERIKKCG